MKYVFTLFLAAFLATQAIAQTSNAGNPPAGVGPRSYSASNIFYKDNLIAHFKEKTGDDLFQTYPEFPRYVDTGDMNKDIPAYHNTVYEWVKNHPDFMKKYNLNPADFTKIL